MTQPSWLKPLLIGFFGALAGALVWFICSTAYADHQMLWQIVNALNANAARAAQQAGK